MKCSAHADCGAYVRKLLKQYYAKATGEAKVRRTREEVVLERDAKARAIAQRREFYRQRRAKKEAQRRAAQGQGQ
jgi:hypothetical protein